MQSKPSRMSPRLGAHLNSNAECMPRSQPTIRRADRKTEEVRARKNINGHDWGGKTASRV